MTKFMLLYRGEGTPIEQMTDDQAAEANQLWTTWMEKHGPSLADGGAPFAARAAVGGDGKDQPPTQLNGYTVVEADSLEAAKGFCDGHPFLHGTGPEFAIDVFELAPMPM
jgi:hypothetical protein